MGWRLSLGLAAVPALVFFIGSVLLPDSPNSLIQRGHDGKGRQVLDTITTACVHSCRRTQPLIPACLSLHAKEYQTIVAYFC